MKLIDHPYIMSLYDVYETGGELYLVLEHVEGGELFDYLVKRGRLGENEARKFFQQMILGLDFCHKHLICHRDLKPENLLLDAKNNVKIADFGMASLQVTGKMLETSCGSPHYASPEIIRGDRYDGATSDIWSCGVILYALLTGSLPFDDENIRRLLSKVKNGQYALPDYIPPSAGDLIKRMLVIDPTQRINIESIKQHPWFMLSSVEGLAALPRPPTPEEVGTSVADPSRIDMDIVQSLSVIGWGNEQDLVAALLNSDHNMEKVFYYLLAKRKWEYFENFHHLDYPEAATTRSAATTNRLILVIVL